MKKIIDLTAYLLILLVLYGCNGDVFVDDFRSSDSELTLDGNGDSAVIRFASSNWDLLQIYTYDENFSYSYEIYGTDGKLITIEQFPYMKGLGKIVCNEELTGFTVERSNPQELKITVDENARSTHFRFMIIASNEYESQEIYVEISPSDRYVFDHVTYSLDAYSFEIKTEREPSTLNYNNTDNPYTLLISPYENVYSSVIFRSDMPGAFQLLKEDNLTVEIPSMEDGSLVMNGKQAQYTSLEQTWPFPNMEKKEVYIPPRAYQRITPLIDYEWFETRYTLYATHPKTGKQRSITGMLQSKMPEKYEIEQKDLK